MPTKYSSRMMLLYRKKSNLLDETRTHPVAESQKLHFKVSHDLSSTKDFPLSESKKVKIHNNSSIPSLYVTLQAYHQYSIQLQISF